MFILCKFIPSLAAWTTCPRLATLSVKNVHFSDLTWLTCLSRLSTTRTCGMCCFVLDVNVTIFWGYIRARCHFRAWIWLICHGLTFQAHLIVWTHVQNHGKAVVWRSCYLVLAFVSILPLGELAVGIQVRKIVLSDGIDMFFHPCHWIWIM